MVDPDRRPTAQEIEELIDLVRRDPSSPAFIDLGEAYLALGRPRDAVQVGNLGLEASPDNLEGRVMLARAHASMHQWKEAQGELLRVVKVDRANRQGFALLGEVLLRRSDYERAVPVLQHAQNLDPTSPQILSMLRRARAGQALDPPSPIPQPIPPRGETDNSAEIQRSRQPATAHQVKRPPAPAPAPAGPRNLDQLARGGHVPAASPMMPTMAIEPAPAYMPPPQAPPPPAPLPRGPKQTAPPQMSVEGIKPRVISSAKPQNAAAASLRQSAAVGEAYLNDLLTGGLLDVAGVRVPEMDYDLRPDRRWGRSTRRAFIFLFVVLVLGIGGTTTWYVFSEKAKAEQAAELRAASKQALVTADYPKFVEGLDNLQQALQANKHDNDTLSNFVEVGGLGTLLYGEIRFPNHDDATKEIVVGADQIEAAFVQVTQGEKALKPEDEGYRGVQIGKAALDLAKLPSVAFAKAETVKAAAERLTSIIKTMDELLAKNPNDKWAAWLKGRAQWALGDRSGAMSTFKLAAKDPEGVVVARIDIANLLADDGKTDEALKVYKEILEAPATKNHLLAMLGENLAKAEASVDLDKVIDSFASKELGAVERLPTRLVAYRWLGLATVRISLDDYKGAADALTKAYLGKNFTTHPITEPRFWARVGWLHFKLGRTKSKDLPRNDLDSASESLKNCRYLSIKADKDPAVQLLDAGMVLASGKPSKVIEETTKLDGVRPKVLKLYALLDLSKAKDAVALSEEVLKAAGDTTGSVCGKNANDIKQRYELHALHDSAVMISGTDKERQGAAASLTCLANGNQNLIPRHLLGVSFLQFKDASPIDKDVGSNLEFAKKSLKKAVDDITEDQPNPLLYRTLTALAEIALIEKDIDAAGKTLDQSLDVNSGYFPTLGLQARIVLRNQDPDKALDLVTPIMREPDAVTPIVQLTAAEALATHKKNVSARDKDDAKKLILDLKGKPGITDEELGRVAALIDDKLPEELGVANPATPDKKPPKDNKKPPKHK